MKPVTHTPQESLYLLWFRFTQAYVKLNNQKCLQDNEKCFNRASGAASLLGARHATNSLKNDFMIVHVGSKPTETIVTNFEYIIGPAVAVVFVIVIVVVLGQRKRKRQRGIPWNPEGFVPKKTRREPIGQDDFKLKVGIELF